MIGRYGLWFLGAVLVLGIVLSSQLLESESDKWVELLEQRLTLLEGNEIDQIRLFEDLDQLRKRLAALENTIANGHWETKVDSSEFFTGIEGENQGDLDAVSSRLDELERQLVRVDQQLLTNQAITDVSFESPDQTGSTDEALQDSFQLLDQAVETGLLNSADHDQLDKIVSSLDPKSSQLFWERLFADLEAGKYRLPDVERPAEHVELPYGEVVGE